MDFSAFFNDIFELCVIPLLAILTVYLVQFIRVKSGEVVENKDNALFNKYFLMLSDTVVNCVLATNQTYVDALKAAGSFDKEAQKKALQMTYDAVVAALGTEAQYYLSAIYGDLQVYIMNMIEAEVHRNKA